MSEILTKKLKNTTGSDLFHSNSGTNLVAGDYTEVDQHILVKYNDTQLWNWFDNGDVIFNDGTTDYTNKYEGWHRLFNFALGSPFLSSSNSNNDFDNSTVQEALEEIDFRQLLKEPTGFPNRTDSTISFDDGTRTFTIAPTSSSFSYWIRGHEYIKTESENVQIDDTEGMWFIYYADSTLTASQTPWSFEGLQAFISIIYWDADNNEAILFCEERHGATMDWATHSRLHNAVGAVKAKNTLELLSYTLKGDGSSDTHAQFGLEDGTIFDEDIEMDIVHDATPTNEFEQYLRTYAKVPLLYRTGSTPKWRKIDATNFAVSYDGTNPIKYNYYNDGTGEWSLTQCDNGSYVTIWLFATNNINEPIVGIIGYTNSDSFVSAAGEALDKISEGLPVPEFCFLYKLIFRTDTNYTNTPKAILYGFYDTPDLSVSIINTTVVGAIQKFTFGTDANAGNKWLSHELENVSGEDVPAIIGYDSELRAIYFNNNNANIDIDIEIYKNGTDAGDKVYTLEVRDSKWRFKTDLPTINFSPGDHVRVYLRKQPDTANDVLVQLEFKIIDESDMDSSGNT